MRPEIDQLIAELRRDAQDHELAAAHAGEFIPDGTNMPQELTHALQAAIDSGIAIGLRHAAALLADLADG